MKINYKEELNSQQYEAVSAIDGPVLIIAGAGSGKTRCLTYRVAYLIEHGVAPEAILLLTFTNKAANEMKERAGKMLDERCGRITACTYHSFCAKQLRKYASLIDYDSNYTILDSPDTADIISMMKVELGYHKMKGFPKSNIVASIISASINKNRSIGQIIHFHPVYQKYKYFSSEIIKLQAAASEYKKEHNMMDYDDILVNFLHLLRTCPHVAHRLSDIYQYIMVDEYQDSNHIQEQILFELRKNNNNLCVVGDDSQSIYGFRGSEVENILHYPQKMPGCKTVYLTQNYRSNQEIMDLSNHVMKKNATEGYPKELVATHHKYAKPRIIRVNDQMEEANFIINMIQQQLKKGLPAKEICVLIRNNFQSNLLETKLSALGIPYDKYGGIKFMEKAHVKDILAYLRCLTNQRDEIAWYRILMLHYGIGKTYARRIASELVEHDINYLIMNEYTAKSFYNELLILHQHLTSSSELELKDLIDHVLTFYKELRERNIKNMDTDDEENRKKLLIELAEDMEELDVFYQMIKPYTELVDFMDDLTLDNKKEKEVSDDKLIVSTIHSAKGLEFTTVFVMDCVDEVFPSTSAKDAGTKSDNEELRCFYVAMTRAKENLYMLTPEYISKYNKPIRGKLSHFLTSAKEYVSL